MLQFVSSIGLDLSGNVLSNCFSMYVCMCIRKVVRKVQRGTECGSSVYFVSGCMSSHLQFIFQLGKFA